MIQILSKEKREALEQDNQDELVQCQKEFFEWRTRRLRAKNKALLDFVRAEIEKSNIEEINIDETK